MEADGSRVDWRRVLGRGSVIGIVLGSHLALLVGILAPPNPRSQRERIAPTRSAALQVLLLSAPTLAALPASHARTRRLPRATIVSLPSQRRAPARITHATTPMLVEPPAASALGHTSAYIAGGGFSERLDAAQVPPRVTKLPGGHHYLAADLQFVPIEQQSIAGKVQKVAGLLFGRIDPTCANAAYELAKSRAQMLADGYTVNDLKRLQREHHCN